MNRELVLSREAVRELDRRAIEEYGIPSIVLMENAGRACACEVRRELGERPGEVLVLCGPGNNGGDGLVIARTLANQGVEVRALFIGAASRLERASADVRTNARLWGGLGRELPCLAEPDEVAGRFGELGRATLVVDALFGTGLDRNLRSPWLELVRQVNARARSVVAVDVPSGLDANTGAALGAAVEADVTVTFVARKPGLERGMGRRHAGRVVVAEIGIPRVYLDELS